MKVWRVMYNGVVIAVRDSRESARLNARAYAIAHGVGFSGFTIQRFSPDKGAGPERGVS